MILLKLTASPPPFSNPHQLSFLFRLCHHNSLPPLLYRLEDYQIWLTQVSALFRVFEFLGEACIPLMAPSAPAPWRSVRGWSRTQIRLHTGNLPFLFLVLWLCLSLLMGFLLVGCLVGVISCCLWKIEKSSFFFFFFAFFLFFPLLQFLSNQTWLYNVLWFSFSTLMII